MTRLTTWAMPFHTLRTRLLAWYFLLAVCATVSAIGVTRQLYCARLDEKAEESLTAEVERFDRTITQQTMSQLNANQPGSVGVTAVFDSFLADYVPTSNEFILTFVEGQLYRTSQPLPNWLSQEDALFESWSNLQVPESERWLNEHHRLFYAAEPLVMAAGERGVFVALRDSTEAYQSGTATIRLVLLVSIATLGGFSVVAWVSAGRILRPLCLINQTALGITESDMTRRIPIKGNDEISAIATTFNAMLDRLQHAFDSQQEFLKDVSHELRTPITVIQGQLELLPYRPEKQPETIALISGELAQMSRLVNDLLLLTKAERPDFLCAKSEDLDWLTEELYLKARSFSTERNWQLEAKGLYPVSLDKQRFSQAVMNLVQNAVRHTKVGDTIALGSAVKGDHMQFWVRDTGEGIAPENRERIFERFARATNNNRQFEGAGLGLSIVSAIVSAHGGRIELESELGQGTVFTLILPLETDALETDTIETTTLDITISEIAPFGDRFQ